MVTKVRFSFSAFSSKETCNYATPPILRLFFRPKNKIVSLPENLYISAIA